MFRTHDAHIHNRIPHIPDVYNRNIIYRYLQLVAGCRSTRGVPTIRRVLYDLYIIILYNIRYIIRVYIRIIYYYCIIFTPMYSSNRTRDCVWCRIRSAVVYIIIILILYDLPSSLSCASHLYILMYTYNIICIISHLFIYIYIGIRLKPRSSAYIILYYVLTSIIYAYTHNLPH